MVFCCWWWWFCCCFPYLSKFSKPASDEMSWYLRLVQLDGHYIKYLILTKNLILKPYVYFFIENVKIVNVYIYIHVIIFVTQICNYKATFHMWRSTQLSTNWEKKWLAQIHAASVFNVIKVYAFWQISGVAVNLDTTAKKVEQA